MLWVYSSLLASAAVPPDDGRSHATWGLLAELAGTSWKSDNGSVRRYEWKKAGQILELVVTDGRSVYRGDFRISPRDKSIVRVSMGQEDVRVLASDDSFSNNTVSGQSDGGCRISPNRKTLSCELKSKAGVIPSQLQLVPGRVFETMLAKAGRRQSEPEATESK